MHRFPVRHRAMVSALRALRTAAGLSQRALSEKLGEVHNYIGRIEGLRRDVSFTEFLAICAALEADPADVVRQVVPAQSASRKR